MDTTNLKVYLPFDESTTRDLCGNTWMATGTPTISDNALQLNGTSYLQNDSIAAEIGNDIWTIHWRATSIENGNDHYMFGTFNANYGTTGEGKNKWIAVNYNSGNPALILWGNDTGSGSSLSLNQSYHYALSYDGSTLRFFIDGQLKITKTFSVKLGGAFRIACVGGRNNSLDYFKGTIDEFIILKGEAWTENFTPPTAQDYLQLKLQLDGQAPFDFTADVERRISTRVEFDIDIERTIIQSIIVPLIGDHFNHCVQSITVYRDKPQPIILPKKSVAYIRATGDGALRIFSDTDAEGKKTGEFYATFDECQTVFIEVIDSPLRVIKAFMHSLDETTLSGDAALDEAINFCTGGAIADKDTLVDNFMRDKNSMASDNFLQNCCDINLTNEDTGAITGSDAGGGSDKTSKSIVPEPVPVKDWVVPKLGSSKTIRGLTVQFPSSGASGALTDAEKHILAGLNSVWFEQSLILIEKSFGLDFNEAGTTVKTISVKFENDSSSDALAYTSYSVDTTSGKAAALSFVVNMNYYNLIDTESPDGYALYVSLYLDRTIAHELTHAVMAANINNFSSLPMFIKEGAAELVHGIDDLRRKSIRYLTARNVAKIREIFSTGGSESDGDYPYSVGYLFLRYLAKQGQDDSFAPATLDITDLLISDGATDSDYEALTDNTRQLFSPDILRTLIKPTSPAFDVEIFDVIPVEVIADAKRELLAKVILFPTDTTQFFSGAGQSSSGSQPVIVNPDTHIPPVADSTTGLQSFEVTIAEQQITDQVKFTGIIPFDIMQQVSGQYFDYNYNMRVERVRQEGILYSCDCCSDIDKLLYTQIDYIIPPMTWYRRVDGETVGEFSAVKIHTHYPPASEHVNKIAAALGLSPVMQFEDFQSTVLTDDLGGVTYNDLIRDVFGWSSRVPTQLINVFIRDGNLFAIQRGHESHSIDISNADMTLPVITKELIRTTWGSSITSQTFNSEMDIPYFVPADRVIDDSGDDNPDDDDDEDEEIKEVVTNFYGKDYQGYTTYSYNRKGLLVKTYTYMRKDIGGLGQYTYTTVDHTYDEDGTMIQTQTSTQSTGVEGNSESLSREQKGYVILANGEKFLAWEKSETYQNDAGLGIADSNLVDSKYTVHSPSRVGQSHTITVDADGDIVGAVSGQNTGDDRVTPFKNRKAAALSQEWDNKEWDSELGEWKTKKEEYGQTVYGLSLYDSSFPIHNTDKLIQVTNALKDLNRKTQETLNVSIYDFEHIIDFNDTVILNGAQYFLVANTVRTTPRIRNEQNLTLVRWY